MTSEITKADVMEMLCRQAQILLCPERTETLLPALEERADHVWRVLSSPIRSEDEP